MELGLNLEGSPYYPEFISHIVQMEHEYQATILKRGKQFISHIVQMELLFYVV